MLDTSMMTAYICLVCGWKGLENKPTIPFNSNEICACCGSQYGLDIQDYTDVIKVRTEWLQEGAEWFDNEDDVSPSKPNNWNVDVAKRQIKDAFGDP